jgi:flagellar hook-associated protein 2
MGISSPGIGSGLDVSSLVSKLMSAEAAPLQDYDTKSGALQTQIQAYGQLSGAIGSFQGALSSLSSASTFQGLTANATNGDVLSASATSTAAPGSYRINVSQLAQAQSLNTPGQASMTATIGGAAVAAKLTFEFGSLSGGNFGLAGTALAAKATASGIAKGSLSINGTVIGTDSTTKSAQALADAINEQSDTTGVTAALGTTTTSATLFGGSGHPSFGSVVTDANSTYALSVGGVQIAAQAAGTDANTGVQVTAASIDATLGADNATTQALAAAGITFSGKASDGSLTFSAADGSPINVSESASGGGVTGGLNNSGTANSGSTVTATAGVTLSSTDGSPITVGGSNPALAGLSAGTGGSYTGASFSLDGTQTISTITLDPADQTLAGIRDAINKANMGVTASIVSDGSSSPYHLVLASTKTGANATMKIAVSNSDGSPADPALANLLSYDPAGTQALQQTSAAQDTLLNVNGIAVQSHTTDVSDAISGVTISAKQTGASSLTVARDTASVTKAINGFVSAYNTLNSTISKLTGYNADSKQSGALQGDFTVRSIQSQLRAQLGHAVQGLDGLTTLSQIGVSFQKDGSLAVDTAKLNKAMTSNYSDIAGLFAAVGQASDGDIKVAGSSAATKAGNYAVNITTMATQATLSGSAKLTGPTTIAADTTWSVTLNQTDPTTASKVQNVSIPAGSYTPEELAAVLRSSINGNSAFAGSGDTVAASIDANGKLALSSAKWGSGSNLTLSTVSGTDPATLFGSTMTSTGVDVAGTIGGVQATGNGQTLSGAVGSSVEGLKLSITGGVSGARGDINFSQGYAVLLSSLSTNFIGTSGVITGRTTGLNNSIKSISDQKAKFQTHLNDLQKMYTTQFNALDTMLSSMQSTQSYLTQQLASIAANSGA